MVVPGQTRKRAAHLGGKATLHFRHQLLSDGSKIGLPAPIPQWCNWQHEWFWSTWSRFESLLGSVKKTLIDLLTEQGYFEIWEQKPGQTIKDRYTVDGIEYIVIEYSHSPGQEYTYLVGE